MRRLRIAFISVARNTIPPKVNIVDGISNISSLLAEGLSKKGHKITFFCPRGSAVNTAKVESPLYSTGDFYRNREFRSLSPVARAELLQPFNGELHLLLLKHILKREFDLVHFNTSPLVFSLPFARRVNIPKVFTLHDQFSEPYDKILNMYSHDKKNYFVSISFYQRKLIGKINCAANIYNGIDKHFFSFQEKGDNYIFFSGRFHPVKGLDTAIKLAKRLNKQLIFTGQLSYSNLDYYDIAIKPHIDNKQIVKKELLHMKELVDLYSGAKLLIFPIQWEEPFGLVLAESMATGTPVVAFARGSVPEVIKDGETGFIVSSSDDDIRGNWIIKKTGIDGLCEAVERIYSMPEEKYKAMRRNCRSHVEKNFTVDQMVDQYDKLYRNILKGSK